MFALPLDGSLADKVEKRRSAGTEVLQGIFYFRRLLLPPQLIAEQLTPH